MSGVEETRWVELYEALEKPLYNAVYRWLWDPAESQDIVQEAFLRCWRMRRRIECDGVKALLFRVALRLASNHRRRRKLWRVVRFDSAHEVNLGWDAEPTLVPQVIRDAFDALPDTLKRVLVLSDIAGMTYAEIAEVMQVREGTVGSRRSRAITRLRYELAARGVDWNED